jgi:hypothetical protein
VEQVNLLMICVVAFAAVFVLLSLLALAMRVIVASLPHKETAADAAVLAAITSAYQSLYPGTKVTKIEELR